MWKPFIAIVVLGIELQTASGFTIVTTSSTTQTTTRPYLPKSSTTTTSSSSLGMSSTMAVDTSSLLLFGHPGTRSPLINWACYELGFEISVASDLSTNPHPFGQIPCLTDNKGNTVVYESGAILIYLLQHYSLKEQFSREQSAAITSWIVWANASLDPICFLETPDGKVYDTGCRKPNRRLDQLNTILSQQTYLVRGSCSTNENDDDNNSIFTIADVAIVSYLAYVLQFFPDVTIADKWPAIARYMQTCISRPTYGQAFTTSTQQRLLTVITNDIAKASGSSTNNNKDKKLFGMF